MTRTRKSKLIIALMTVVLALSVLFGLVAWRNQKPTVEASAAESVNVTQVQFRTDPNGAWLFLRMEGQTDYTTPNQWHGPEEVTSNVLDNVTVYFLNGTYSLRELWRGDAFGTYVWGETDSLVFPMKEGFYANQGVGVKIDAGTEMYMIDGANKVTATSRSFWSNGTGDNQVIGNYTDGFQTIATTISKIHIRGAESDIHLMIGLGAGNDWDGKGEAICTQAQGEDGSNDYALNYWMNVYLANFTSKIKLHLKESNTWVNYGSIIRRDQGAQMAFIYNGWGESGGIMRLKIDNAYNGTTVDKVLFEEGCELPSYEFNGKPIAHTVHVLDKAYLFESGDMSTPHWAVNWTASDVCKVTFNGGNAAYVKPGDAVAFPTALSETKPDDDNGSYIYNWFLNGEKYDFTAPVTQDINLTSDGSFTLVPRMNTLTYLNEDGSTYATERYSKDTIMTLLATPEKVGYDGVWKTLDGESAPTAMPDGDLTLQVVYTKNFYVRQVQFRTSGGAWFFLRFNSTDYTAANKQQAASFVDGTNLLDKVTVYFDDGIYSLREIWDGATIMTYLWGDDDTLCFKLKESFVANKGFGARIDAGTEIPMENSVVTTDVSRTFWTEAEGDRGTDFGIGHFVDGYEEIETTVDGVFMDGRLIIDLGEGNDWAGKGQALPTQAQDENGSTTHASAHWHIMYLANFKTKIKLHVQETDTWVNLGDVMDLMENAGSPQWMFIFNGWNNVDGILRISINHELYNGITVDKVVLEKGCQLPSYNATAGAGHILHVLTEDYIFGNANMDSAVALDWTRQHVVTFDGANAVYVDHNATVAYPTDLSGNKDATAEYTYVYNWFVNGALYDFSTPITGNIDIVSDGTYTEIPNEYKVTYYALDGVTVLYEDVFAYGEALTVRAAESIEGYVDCSWNYSEAGDVPSTMPAKDISFTVQGTAKTYTLTIGEETLIVTYAQAIGQLPAVPEEEGYSGVWTIDGEAISADYIWLFDADKAAEAYYTANSYVLTFGEGETLVVTYGEAIGQLPAVPEREHYVGAWAVDGTELNADMVWPYASDKTAEAVYTAVNYTVTFDGKNATEYAYGSKVAKPADPVKEATAETVYTFDAWYVGDAKWNFDTDVVGGDTALVAKFTEEARKYTVTFVIEGHTLTLAPVEVAYGETVDLNSLFTEEQVAGYTYSVTVNGVEKASIKVVADVTVSITFTAKTDVPAASDSSANNGGILSKLGCSGVVGGLSMAVVTLTLAGAVLLCKRKED